MAKQYLIAAALLLSACGASTTNDALELPGILVSAEVRVQAAIAGRVGKVLVRDGDWVEAEQVLVEFDGTSTLRSVEQARARVADGEARVQRLRKMLELEIEQSRVAGDSLAERIASLEKSKAQADARAKGIQTSRTRVQAGMMVREESDQEHIRLQLTEAEIGLLNERIITAKAEHESLKKRTAAASPQMERIDAAEIELREARARLQDATEQNERTQVRAPKAGVVAALGVDTGQIVERGQVIATVYSVGEIWAQAYVEESRIGGIRMGAPASVVLSSGERVQGAISFVAVEGDYASQRNVSREWRDLRTFGIRIRIPNADRKLRPGMSVRATITVSRNAP
jgi:multidrug resistance efflux pump